MIYLVPSILYSYFVDMTGNLATRLSMLYGGGGGGSYESTYDVE